MPARILVIEDNAANMDLMIYLLEAFGHTTYAAGDGLEGLEIAALEGPDLIICDIHLPKLDGYGVVLKLKEDPVLCTIPVIAVTALAMVGDRDKVLQAGFDGYLTKPIDPEVFVQQIASFRGGDSTLANVFEVTASADRAPNNGATILAVDNVPANLDLVRSILEPFGYHVLTASGGREALVMARLELPDLILSDVCMEDGSGHDFIRAVKADPLLSSIPFLFVTSTMVEPQDRSAGLALGAARFLFRPLEPEQLLAELEACLADRELSGQDSHRR